MSGRVVEAARLWIGTPFCHQASARGQGCDCLGLIRGVYRDVSGKEAVLPDDPADYRPGHRYDYRPDWAQRGAEERLLTGLSRHLETLPAGGAQAGDVLVFRIRTYGPASHCAIVSGPGAMLHAWQRRGVCETALCAGWRRRTVARFGFPSPSPAEYF
ncbi:NlpC/P60 family protein [Marinicauda sp. Alg238-R41]|uniref:NlpC/P60 family protein n=1 Tax=Marinicauda sp. Alg238-R41 TaxID=2993447 RepID=UPI0022E80FAA|nr:NlpC/P60 family protein [Marinicauda sp. Alg238-R41]